MNYNYSLYSGICATQNCIVMSQGREREVVLENLRAIRDKPTVAHTVYCWVIKEQERFLVNPPLKYRPLHGAPFVIVVPIIW
jgi:hypothetical protein